MGGGAAEFILGKGADQIRYLEQKSALPTYSSITNSIVRSTCTLYREQLTVQSTADQYCVNTQVLNKKKYERQVGPSGLMGR